MVAILDQGINVAKRAAILEEGGREEYALRPSPAQSGHVGRGWLGDRRTRTFSKDGRVPAAILGKGNGNPVCLKEAWSDILHKDKILSTGI